LPRGIRREKHRRRPRGEKGEGRGRGERGTQRKIHPSARDLRRARLNESLLKERARARALIKLSVNTTRYRMKTGRTTLPRPVLTASPLKTFRAGNGVLDECLRVFLSASVHAHAYQRRAALRHECSTVAVMHVHSEETARLQFTRNGDVVLVYLGRRSAAAALPPPRSDAFLFHPRFPTTPSPFSASPFFPAPPPSEFPCRG